MNAESRVALVADADTASCRALTQHLWQLGFVAKLAHTGLEAMEAAREQRFDVVFVEIRLPDIGGHALARELSRSHEVPVVIVTDSSDIDHAIVALRNGVADFLRKPVDLPQLDLALSGALHRRDDAPRPTAPARDSVATASVASRTPSPSNGRRAQHAPPGGQPTIAVEKSRGASPPSAGSRRTSPAVKPPPAFRLETALTCGRLELPVMDTQLAGLQKFLGGGDFSLSDVAAVVTRDPALTAGVLRRANSARYSRGGIASIDLACQRLGTSRIVGIALEVAVENQFKCSVPAFKDVLRAQWRNAVVSAHIARELGPHCKIKDRDRLHVAALLHNLGELAGLSLYADWASKSGRELDMEAIAEQLALHHEDVGQKVAKAWSLPGYVVRLAGHHHRRARGEPPRFRALRHVVTASWSLALEAGYTYLPNQAASDLPRLLDELDVDDSAVDRIRAAIPTWKI